MKRLQGFPANNYTQLMNSLWTNEKPPRFQTVATQSNYLAR